MGEEVAEKGAGSPPELFKPLNINGLTLANRIVTPPMCTYSATKDGEMQDFHTFQYMEYAVGGVGLIIIEASAVSPVGRLSDGCIGLYNDATWLKIKNLCNFIHNNTKAKVGIQLGHGGRKAGWSKNPWSGNHHPLPHSEGGWTPIAPSRIPFNNVSELPIEMTNKDLDTVKQEFVRAAKRAAENGIDLIELHGAHGYLLHEFMSPISNKRTDEYGGSLENRMRFPIEVFTAVRAAIPASMPLTIRLSATDWVEGGWTLEETVALCKELKKAGADLFDISTGGINDEQKFTPSPGFQVPFATRIKEEVGLPVICVGLITGFDQAESYLTNKKADLVALGRELLRNPRWPQQAAKHFGVQLDPVMPHMCLRAAPRRAYGSSEK